MPREGLALRSDRPAKPGEPVATRPQSAATGLFGPEPTRRASRAIPGQPRAKSHDIRKSALIGLSRAFWNPVRGQALVDPDHGRELMPVETTDPQDQAANIS